MKNAFTDLKQREDQLMDGYSRKPPMHPLFHSNIINRHTLEFPASVFASSLKDESQDPQTPDTALGTREKGDMGLKKTRMI